MMIAIAICNHTPMATAHDFGLILISVEYTTHCYVDFGQTARTFTCFGAHSNLHVLLLADDGAITHNPIYVCDHTPIATAHGSGWILIAVEYTTHCHVDFGRAESTHARSFVLVHVRIWMCCCLVTMIAIARQCVVFMYQTALQWQRLTTPDGY